MSAKTYQSALLKAGLAVDTDCLLRFSGPLVVGLSTVRDIDVNTLLACGFFRHGKNSALLLPPERAALEAVVDALLFESMILGSDSRGLDCAELANDVLIAGRKSKVLPRLEFTKGEISITILDGKKESRSPVEAEIIDCWAVHKSINGNHYTVAHTGNGAAVLIGLSKGEALKLAKELARAPFPFRLSANDANDITKPEWRPARAFGSKLVRHFQSAVVVEKRANPKSYQKVIPFVRRGEA